MPALDRQSIAGACTGGYASPSSFYLDGILQVGDFLAVSQQDVGAPIRPGLPAIRWAFPAAEGEPRYLAGFQDGFVFLQKFAVRCRYADPLFVARLNAEYIGPEDQGRR